MKIVRAVATVGGFTSLSRIFGLVREILMSHVLGAGIVADAFVVAFKFPNFFRRFFAEGAFNAAFVPFFAGKLEKEGKQAAILTAERVFSFLGAWLILLVLAIEIFTPEIMHLLAPGFSTTPERLKIAVTFTRITFPYILFMSLSALLAGILNSFDRFATAAAAPILLNILMILALLAYPVINLSAGLTLVWSVFIAGIVQLVWLYWACKRIGISLRLLFPKATKDVRHVMRKMIPGTIGAGVMQINLLIDMVLASLLTTGSISYLYYADRLNQLPLSIFGVAIGTVLLPRLSRQLRKGNIEDAMESQNLALELALQLSIPSAVGLIVLSFPLINLIYGHGSFNVNDVGATAPALAAFAFGLPAYVTGKVFSTSFFARLDTKTPVKIAIVCIIVNLILNLILMRTLQHVGLALATSISAWLNTILLLIFLKKKELFKTSPNLIKMIGKVVLCSLLMGGAVFFIHGYFNDLTDKLYQKIFSLLFCTCFGIGLYGIFGYWLGIFKTLNFSSLRR